MTEIYQSLIVRAKKKKRVNALIDTGATTTYIRPDIAKTIGAEKMNKIRVELGEKGKFMEGWETFFGINVRKISEGTKGIISNITEELVVGADFLQKRNVVLDFKTHKMKIKRLSIRKMPRL